MSASFTAASGTPPLEPVDLRCEYLRDPLGIDAARPRLSWALRGGGRGERQSAYRVLVASTVERLLAGTGDLWDTGVVPDQAGQAGQNGQSSDLSSVATLAVEYGGPALAFGQRAWWTVEVWNAAGELVAPAAPASWEMGLLAQGDWRAVWIGRDDPRPPNEPPPAGDRPGVLRPWEELDLRPAAFLRRGFALPRPVASIRRARLWATARGVYELRLNGVRAGDALLAPGWSDYRSRLHYQTYDVAPLLRDGANTLGAILGTGWYAGHIGWHGQTAFYGPHPRLLAQLTVEFDDGTVVTVATDDGWRATTGPILASDLLMGEHYDARQELSGWDRPGEACDGGGWEAVATEERDGTPLVADRAEPIRALMELTPVSITPRDDGTTIVDLGQNMTGWARLRAHGPAGTTIRLRFAEVLDPDGGIYTTNLRSAHQTDTVVLAGTGGDEIFEPRFTFHGFRYVEVTGYPGELTAGDLTGVVIGSDLPPAGDFACSDDLVNRIQHAIIWGLRGNFVSIPTDCPQRDERLGWLADAQIFARTATANAGVAAFFTRWLEDVADAQSAEGAFPDVAPRLIDMADGAPAWGDGGVVVPWVVHTVYGDTRVIRERLAGMAAWVEYLHAANPNGLWRNKRNNDFGDWLAVGADTSKELLATAYFAYSADLLARMAAVVGESETAARYRALRAAIGAAFAEAYVGPDGRIAGPPNPWKTNSTPDDPGQPDGPEGPPSDVETQTGYVLALHMNLVPDDLRAAALARLVADIDARGVLTTGFTGVGYILPLLTASGHTDLAYHLLRSERFPSWGYMIRNGATTIWERWDGWTEEKGFQDPNMNSFNHYSLGSVGEWLYRSVAGIDLDPDRPGFAHVVVRPQPGGGLTWARATYRGARGEIASGWEVDGGTLTLRVAIPPGSTATIAVPTSDPDAVMEGDGPATSAPGLTRLTSARGAAVFAAGAGEYVFRGPYSG